MPERCQCRSVPVPLRSIFEKEREQLLSYDGHAFLYFAAS